MFFVFPFHLGQIFSPAVENDSYFHDVPKVSDRQLWANSIGPDPRGAVWSGSTLFPFYLHLSDAHYSTVKPPCSNFRVITAKFSGIWIFMILQYIFYKEASSVIIVKRAKSVKSFTWIALSYLLFFLSDYLIYLKIELSKNYRINQKFFFFRLHDVRDPKKKGTLLQKRENPDTERSCITD